MADIDPKDIKNAISKAEEIEKIKLEQKRQFELVTLLIAVLMVGFFGVSVALGGIIVDGFRSKEASYTEVVKAVLEQNKKIDDLTKALTDSKPEKVSPIVIYEHQLPSGN